MSYTGRPGVSPITALLLAMETIRKGDRILDVGCGDGTEALLLARWGFRRIDAVDSDRDAIRVARGRATRQGLAKRLRLHNLDAAELPTLFPRDTFDVVLHTLVANNLAKSEVEPHFRGIREVMKPEGILVLVERVHRKHENEPPGRLPPLAGLKRHFDLTRGVSTQLPEGKATRGDSTYARVVVWLGRPRK